MQKDETKLSLDEQAKFGLTEKNKLDRDKLALKNEKMLKTIKAAEMKARANEIKHNSDPGAQFPGIDNEILGEVMQYLYANGMGIHRERDYRSNFKFAQLLQNNWLFLNEHCYLTSEEKVFILDLNPFVAIGSNCLVKDVNSRVQEPLNQSQIATILGKSAPQVSRIVKNLISKGILAKAEIPNKDGSKVLKGRSHSIYFNPNILYSGLKEKVNPTLESMFNNPPELLRHMPDQLFRLK